MVARPPIPLEEVAVLDANAEALGVPVALLMENAGRGIADVLVSRAPKGRIVILCGPGNNGGDGLVAARHLSAKRDVTVLLSGDMHSGLASDALDALPRKVGVERSPDLSDAALGKLLDGAGCIVDALLGAGARGAPRGEIARLVRASAGSKAWRASIDTPTGAGFSEAFRTDVTLALHAPKVLPPKAQAGEVVVVDIGIPAAAETHTGPGEMRLYPRAHPEQHKGEGGFVLVIGGGPYSGAPALTAMAAMMVGADLAIVLTPEPVWSTVASFSPNIVARPLEGAELDLQRPANRVTLNKWLGMVDAVAIGPGLGKMDSVKRSVPLAVDRALELGLPVCADADALWALAGKHVDLKGRAVVTPHAKEFEVLTGKAVPPPVDLEGRCEIVQAAARQTHSTVLLKGPIDVISDGERVKRNATGTPAMSHGGTGDVLTGLVAGLLAKGLSPFDAARVGAFISGKAGEIATRKRSYGMLATDVLDAVPAVLKAYIG